MTIAAQMSRAQMPDPETAWAAVLNRDALRDGSFVYAVSSTGVYCRPSCGSRRPRRERVSFFPGAPQAEAAGYRACLRCGKENGDALHRVSVKRRGEFQGRDLHYGIKSDKGLP